MKKELYLTAILPPSHVSGTLRLYQHELFRREGTVSALYLPPHIPLLFSRDSTAERFSGMSPRSAICETVAVVRTAREVYLRVNAGSWWDELRAPLADMESDGPYDPSCGIFLFSRALEPPGTPGPEVLPAPDPLRWYTSTLTCFRIGFFGGEGEVPYGALLETVFSRSLKKISRSGGIR